MTPTDTQLTDLQGQRPYLYQPRAERSDALGYAKKMVVALKGRHNVLCVR